MINEKNNITPEMKMNILLFSSKCIIKKYPINNKEKMEAILELKKIGAYLIPNAIPQKMPSIKIILFFVPSFNIRYVKKADAIVNIAKRNLKLINPPLGNNLNQKAPNKSAKKTILFV